MIERSLSEELLALVCLSLLLSTIISWLVFAQLTMRPIEKKYGPQGKILLASGMFQDGG